MVYKLVLLNLKCLPYKDLTSDTILLYDILDYHSSNMKYFICFILNITLSLLFSQENTTEEYFQELAETKSYTYALTKALDTLKHPTTSPKTIFDAKSFIIAYQLNRNNTDSAAQYLKELKPTNTIQQYLYHCRYGFYYYRKNDPIQQFTHYLKAKIIFDNNHFVDQYFRLHQSLAQFYLEHKNSEKVIATCQDFHKILKKRHIQYHITSSDFYRYEAEGHFIKNDYQNAFQKIDSAIYYAEHFNDTTRLFLAYRLKSFLYLEKKNYKKALEIALSLESNKYNEKNTYYYKYQILNYYTLGRIYFENNDYEKAKPYLKEVTYTVLRYPYHDIYFSALKMYTEILYKENQNKEAYELLSVMERKKDSVYNSYVFSKILNKEISYIQEREELHYKIKEWKWKWLIIGSILLSLGLIVIYIIRYKNIKKLKAKNKLIEDKNNELHVLNNSLEKFAQITSHDLKAPIRSIGHIVTFIQEDEPNLSKETKENLKLISIAIENSNNLIMNMLALAKSNDKNIKKDKVDVHEIFKNVESNLLKIIIDSHTKIIYHENLPHFIEGNQSLLIQLFQNIIQNAIKYHKEEHNPIIEIWGDETKNETTFYIKDNGIGIKQDKIKVLFKAFEQERFESIDKGVGLGLFITKKIADIHHAKIKVESDLGEGTTFSIIFHKN